jgi:raffinose/stachyose/melibiose transport system substrate-binding protein
VNGRLRILVLASTVGLIAMACTPGGEVTQASAPPPPAATGVTETGPVTLTIWDQESQAVGKVWDELNAEFEAKYPNVTIERVNRDFGQLKILLKLAVSGPNAPDVVEVNQGWPDMGQMVKAGLLLPLDNYAEAYGWNKRVPGTVLASNSFTDDGKQFGTGSLFAYTTQAELIGVFYNKAKLTQLGLAVPTTFAEFESALAAAKQAGEVPIQFANSDGWPGIHEFAVVQDQMASVDYLTSLIFGLQGTGLSYETPENVQAAATLQDWAEQGYFTNGFGGIGYDDAVGNFVKGEGVFMITGNWIVANIGKDNADFGFFVMPPTAAGGQLVSTGAVGYPLSITAKSEHPDAAAAYIDWMTSDHALELLVPTGQIPISAGTDVAVPAGTVLADVLDAAGQLNASNGIVPYADWSTPTFYNTLTASIQELMAGRITPEEFTSKLQSDYSAFQSSRA